MKYVLKTTKSNHKRKICTFSSTIILKNWLLRPKDENRSTKLNQTDICLVTMTVILFNVSSWCYFHQYFWPSIVKKNLRNGKKYLFFWKPRMPLRPQQTNTKTRTDVIQVNQDLKGFLLISCLETLDLLTTWIIKMYWQIQAKQIDDKEFWVFLPYLA